MKFKRLALVLCGVVSFTTAEASNDPVLALTFDNPANRLEQTGESDVTFTQNGNVTYDIGGGVGGRTAAVFDGASYLQASASPVSTAFSFTFWMKTTNFVVDQYEPLGYHETYGPNQWYYGAGIIDGEMSGVTTDWGISQLGSNVVVGVGQPDMSIRSTIDVNTGEWVFVAATWESTSATLSLYVNSVLQGSLTGTGTDPRRTDNSFRIGQDVNNGAFAWYKGWLDDIKFYDTALNQQEIQAVQTAAVPEPTTYAYAALAALAFLTYRNRKGLSRERELLSPPL